MKTLYHGSTSEITSPGKGLFCSTSQEVALSHGPVVSSFEVRDADILYHFKLCHGLEERDLGTIREVLVEELRADEDTDIDRAWEIVVDSAGCVGAEDALELFRTADARREARHIRGRICLALGYRAIEMEGEQGTEYLLVT